MNFQTPRAPLNRDHVLRCIVRTRNLLENYIQRRGNHAIPGGVTLNSYGYQSVLFWIKPAEPPGPHQLTYNDTVTILGAYAAEMTRETYRERSAEIFVTDGGKRVGQAFFGLADQGDVISSLPPMANPYPMPGTSFSLAFYVEGPSLVPANVANCLSIIRQEVQSQIQRTGNGLVSSTGFRISNLDFDIMSTQDHTQPPIRFSDFAALLKAFSMKMSREGYQGLYAEILVTEGSVFVGDAQIFPQHAGIERVGRNVTASA